MSLKGIAKATLAILEAGHYVAPSGARRTIAAAQASAEADTCLYTPEGLADLLATASTASPRSGPLGTEVWAETTQRAARRLVQDEGERVVLLNFASARNPGGGFVNGAKAQEEDVARCSGLYPCLLSQPRYYATNRRNRSPLYTDHLIYSPDVPFFRSRSRDVLEEPFVASVITAPAPNAGQVRRGRSGQREIEATLRRRASYVLAAAEDQGHRTLLLGAWGCGVFRNDPARVAAAFGDALATPRFANAFDRVVYAVWDGTKDKHVLRAFEDHFVPHPTPAVHATATTS